MGIEQYQKDFTTAKEMACDAEMHGSIPLYQESVDKLISIIEDVLIELELNSVAFQDAVDETMGELEFKKEEDEDGN